MQTGPPHFTSCRLACVAPCLPPPASSCIGTGILAADAVTEPWLAASLHGYALLPSATLAVKSGAHPTGQLPSSGQARERPAPSLRSSLLPRVWKYQGAQPPLAGLTVWRRGRSTLRVEFSQLPLTASDTQAKRPLRAHHQTQAPAHMGPKRGRLPPE